MTSLEGKTVNRHSAYYAKPENQANSAIKMSPEAWDRQVARMRQQELLLEAEHEAIRSQNPQADFYFLKARV